MTGSSPRSISTPVGPSRLTLQSGQQVPELYSHNQDSNVRNVKQAEAAVILIPHSQDPYQVAR